MMVAKGHIFKFKTSSSKYLMFLTNREQYGHLSNLIKTPSVVKTKLTAGAPFQFLCHKPFKHASPCATSLACSIEANQRQIETYALVPVSHGVSRN